LVWCFQHWQSCTTMPIGKLVVGNLRFRHCVALGLHLNKQRTGPLCCLCWFGAEFFCNVRLVDSTIGYDCGEPFTIVKKPIIQICDSCRACKKYCLLWKIPIPFRKTYGEQMAQ
jgi:hypothetical protein